MPLVPKISFVKVFDYWELWAADDKHPRHEEAKRLLADVGQIKVLRKPFSDLALLKKYEDEIARVLSILFPQALQTNEIKAATLPFQPFFFCATERFKNIIKHAGDDYAFEVRQADDDYYYFIAASFYLQAALGVKVDTSQPQITDILNQETGILRTYRGFFNADFSEFHKTERSPVLSDSEIALLLNNSEDIDLWKRLIPPGSFELHGFGLLTMFDITSDQALSDLKELLISGGAVSDSRGLGDLQSSLSRYLGVSDLQVGMAAVRDGNLMSAPDELYQSKIMDGQERVACEDALCGFSEEHLLKSAKPLIVTDTTNMSSEGIALMDKMIADDIGSFIIIPLKIGEKVIGLIELSSKERQVLNSSTESKMRAVSPLLAVAMNRAIDEFETRVQATIKEKCTAVHPTVEWRFSEAAADLLMKNRNYHEMDMEEIVFDRVFPLFGQMDIKGSSKYRDRAIQSDLICQLELIKAVFEEASEERSMVMYEQLIYEVDQHLTRLGDRLDAGEEPMIMSFFRREVDPIFEHLREVGVAKGALSRYDKRINDKLQVIYEERKSYEETVSTINEHIGSFIESAQRKAQEIFPHYFEKYKTDGVEYNMYIGQSLVKDLKYNDIYLKNLRLWQLVVTCEVENLLNRVRDSLPVPLEVASLIMVQNAPLDIKFRMDEKRFDVDGAYNARYEIIKKRIDKAHIKDTGERLTVPGKIAIVFSSESEKAEYQKYISYLRERDYITDLVEYVELEELPGASGLQAVRIEVNYQTDLLDKNLSEKVREILTEAV